MHQSLQVSRKSSDRNETHKKNTKRHQSPPSETDTHICVPFVLWKQKQGKLIIDIEKKIVSYTGLHVTFSFSFLLRGPVTLSACLLLS